MVVCIEKLEKVDENEIERVIARCLKTICSFDFLFDVRTVLIKPNFLNFGSAEAGITTDLRIVKALIKIFKLLKRDVIVAEASLDNTEEVFQKLGVYELEKLGAKVVNLEKDEKILVKSPAGLIMKTFHLPKTVVEADLIVSVPKMKTHAECTVTLSIKNLFGFLNRQDRSIAHIRDIDKSIVDLFSYFKKNKKIITFIDGLVALEGKLGPVKGNPVNLNLIVVGNDLLAADVTCVKIMDCPPSKVKHIEIATNLGLGYIDDKIVGLSIESVKRKFEMPPEFKARASFVKPIAKKLFKKRPFLAHEEKCILCKRCSEMCPKQAISIENNKIKFDYSKCIGCLVCCESCEQGALDYEITNRVLYKFLRRVKNILKNK